jgi:hypothetical protein
MGMIGSDERTAKMPLLTLPLERQRKLILFINGENDC